MGEVLRQLQSRRQQRGDEGHPTGNTPLETRLSNRQMDRRSGEDVQSHDKGLAELLRSLLQVGALSDAELFEPVPRALGNGEIQTPEEASAASRSVGAQSCVSRPHAVRALAGAASGGGWTVRAG